MNCLTELTIWPDDESIEGAAGLWHVQFFWDEGSGPVFHEHGPVTYGVMRAVVNEVLDRNLINLLDWSPNRLTSQ